MVNLVYREGIPDKPGWWWLWPTEGLSKEPHLYQIKFGSGILGFDHDVLYIKSYPDTQHQTEAYLFKGRIAGPVPEPPKLYAIKT